MPRNPPVSVRSRRRREVYEVIDKGIGPERRSPVARAPRRRCVAPAQGDRSRGSAMRGRLEGRSGNANR